MSNLGKQRYDQIPVPEELERVIWDAMRREEREKRVRRLRRWVTTAVAVFCVLFACANIAPIYAHAAQLPVIGTIIRVLHIGCGGEQTDGAHVDAQSKGETVQFQFESLSQELNAVPVYSVMHQLAPNRVILTLQGVRSIDYAAITQSLLATDAVRDVYMAMIGDDTMWGFVIVLNSGYTYEVTEYTDPPFLAVRFYPDEAYQPDKMVYYLRSEPMPFGEELGIMAEMFYWDGATQLKTQSGDYLVTVGQYSTTADATAALRVLEDKIGMDTGLCVSSGLADHIPEK